MLEAVANDLDQRRRNDGEPPLIPDHKLNRRIGGGAYGEVWLARNAVGTMRAVKIIRRDRHETAESFEREFKGLQKFEPVSRTHDGLVDILSLGHLPDGAGFYYVMELADDAVAADVRRLISNSEIDQSLLTSAATYVPRTLRAELKARGALSADKVIALALKLTAALAHLHAQGLVHRDVKPSNILFIGDEPKLADAGLVAAMDDAQSLVGTAGYIAPEGPGTPQADLYALGKVLYEAAFGKDRQEFPALPANVASRHDHARLLELNAILLKACATDRRERYLTAEHLRADLELLQQGYSVRRKRTLDQSWLRLKKTALAFAASAPIAALTAILVWQFTSSDVSNDGPPSKNEDANALCAKALQIIRSDDYDRFLQAYTNLNKAIELDPNFARPYVGLLEIRLREAIPSLGPMRPDEYRIIATRLKALAPNLAATHCVQALVSYNAFNYPQARQSLLKAVKAGPDYELAHTVYGGILLHWGWPKEAREQLLISRRLAPSKVHVFYFLGYACYQERDYTNAIAWHRKALQLEPRNGAPYSGIAEAYEAMGDYTNALVNYETSERLRGGDADKIRQRYADLRRALDEGGVRGYWLECERREQKYPNQHFCWKAIIQMHLGNTNAALDLLDKSYDARESFGSAAGGVNALFFRRCWDGVQDHPRFKALLEKTTFSKVIPPRGDPK